MKNTKKKNVNLKNNVIPIVFATNENYAPYAGVTITSIIENSSKDYFYDIYIFWTNLSKDTISKFQTMKGENFSVTCLDVNHFIDKELNLYENFHFSKEMYYRILIPTILSQYNKVIYLDCDMVVLGDISELFQIDVSDYVIGGVSDEQHKTSKDYTTNILKLDPEFYINSGMLLINCKKFNELKIKDKCFNILSTSKTEFRYPDQDIINLACSGKIKFLDPCWNYIWHYNFPREDKPNLLLSYEDDKRYKEKSKNIKILHYTSNIKPWNNYNISLSKYFFDFAQKTSQFKDIILNRFNNIKMKNYICMQSIDIYNDKIVLIGAFYSIENLLCCNKVYCKIGEKNYPLKFYYSKNIDLRNMCYVQNFFEITIKKSQLQNSNLNVVFFIKNDSYEYLPILSGKWFPVDANTKSKFFFDNSSLFIENKILKFIYANKKDKKVFEKNYRKSLKKLNNNRARKSLIVRKLYFLTKPFIKKDIWLITDRTNIAGDNGEAFFKYVCDHNNKPIKPYFVIEKSSPDYKKMKKIGKVVDPNSNKYKFLFLHCKNLISSHLPRNIIEPYNMIYLKDLLYAKKNIFLQHGVTKDDVSGSYSRLNQDISAFISVGQKEYESIVSNKKYGLSSSRVWITGFPRYDILESDTKNIIYILPTWRKNIEALIKKSVDGAKKSQFYLFYKNFLESSQLEKLTLKYGYKVKFVPHELAKPLFEGMEIKNPNVEILTNNVSYNEIFKSGALLITDYSSVAFDFAYLKKPVIYCQFDKEEFFHTHTYKPGYFKYEKDGFGKVTYDMASLLKEIENVLSNNCEMSDEFKKRSDEFFRYHDKNNCKRIYNRLTKDIKPTLINRCKICYKENGLAYTIKRIFIKIFRIKSKEKTNG